MIDNFNAAVSEYLEAIKADYAKFGEACAIRQQMIDEFNESLTYEVRQKFIKVITGPQKSVHSFIVLADDDKFKRGDILKAASWKAPAKNFARGNVLTGQYQTKWTGA